MSTEALPRTFGPYTLIKLLARGGMGEIFLARTAGLAGFQKYCAVKKLLDKFAQDADVTTRFIDEAKLGARLCHPNIVQVSDLGRIGDELYMAAEFVDGFDLRRILRFCHEKKKRIPLDIALFVVREVLSGLAYAHKQVDAAGQRINLIHRDISPQNVLVSFEGEVKIIDFGLAKSTQRSRETQANVLLGNFGYMSPEQARGKQLDERTDVYSVGIVLFELVTGTKRFVDDNPLSLLEKVAHPAPLLPSERADGVPPEVDALFLRAVEFDPEQRFGDAAQFRDEVTRTLHRINPRAAREHLAAFLEHLFLGGPAPQTQAPDDDPLNRSVSLAVADLVAGSPAFSAPKENDLKNRALSHFDDDAPQTQDMPALRAARLGDVLDEDVLLGRAQQEPDAVPAVAGAPIADPASRAPQVAEDEPSEHEPRASEVLREITDPASRPPALHVDAPSEVAPGAFDVPDSALAQTEIHQAPELDDNEPTRVGGAPTPSRARALPVDVEALPPLELEAATPVIEDDFLTEAGRDIELDAPPPASYIQVKPPRPASLPMSPAPAVPVLPPLPRAPAPLLAPRPAEDDIPMADEDDAIEIDLDQSSAPAPIPARVPAPAPAPFPQSLTRDIEAGLGAAASSPEPFHESLIIDFDEVAAAAGTEAEADAAPAAPARVCPAAPPSPKIPSAASAATPPPRAEAARAADSARIRPAAAVRPLRAAIVTSHSASERRRRDDRPVIKRDETANRSRDGDDK